MKLIPITRGKFMKVDDEDFEFATKYKYQFTTHGYAIRSKHLYSKNKKEKKIACFFHRELLNAPKGMQVDHINHDKLDNRKCNLRICTRSQNNMNRKNEDTKGISWYKNRKLWVSYIKLNGKRFHLGYFKNKIDALKAYNKKSKELFGEFAYLNKI